jgi:drug/metabolite transporter (DMT)-like permease
MAVLLGVLVAASFGSGDFLGGRASRRAPTLTVLFVAQIAAVAGAALVCAFVGAHVAPHDIAFGALAGSFNIIGIGLLYQGLAVGRMGVVAPLTAVVSSMVPIAWGVANGERPSAIVVVGVLFALVAGALISRASGEHASAGAGDSAVAWAVGAGVCLGTSLVLYAQTSSDSGMWPVFTARAAAFVLVALALLFVAVRRVALPFPAAADRRLAISAGVLDVTASALLLLAVRRGLLVVVAPLAALAPAATVLLARVVLHEHLHPIQRVGLVLALLGIVLIVAG